MKRRLSLITALILSCLMLTFPAFAGEWIEIELEDDQTGWQYILDDDSYATGWVDIDEERYYFDEDGYRKESFWQKDGRYWYYLQEDGTMAVSTWVDNYYVDEDGRKTKTR